EPGFILPSTSEHVLSPPSTGEWTHPAGGFVGAEMSLEWHSSYPQVSAYMADDNEPESRLYEVHDFLRSVMRQVRSHWSKRLPECVFTVNECNDPDEVIHATFTEINRDA